MRNKIEKLISNGLFENATKLISNSRNILYSWETEFYFGVISHKMNSFCEAEKRYLSAIKLKPDYVPALSNLILLQKIVSGKNSFLLEEHLRANSVILSDNQLIKLAAVSGNINLINTRNIELTSLSKEALMDYARLMLDKNEFMFSAKAYKLLRANNVEAESVYINFSVCLNNLDEFEKAQQLLKEGIKKFPSSWKLKLNLSTALIGLKNFEEAFDFANEAYKKDQSLPVLINLARCNHALGFIEKAEDFACRALLLGQPANLLQIRADIAASRFDYSTANCYYEMAFKADPTRYRPKWNQSLLQLREGDFENGWSNYDFGFLVPRDGRGTLKYNAENEWHPATQCDQLIVWAEQGVGDEVMFLQFLKYIPKEMRVKYVTSNRMVDFFKQYYIGNENIQFVSNETVQLGVVKNERHIMAGSLPKYYWAIFNKDRLKLPYLRRNNSCRRSETVVGCAWRGGASKDIIKHRSLPLQSLVNALLKFSNTNVKFLPLQYNITENELHFLKLRFGPNLIYSEYDRTQDLVHWADDISSCDVIVSNDNSVVHFAGAMGLKTNCFLPRKPEWRWLLSGNSTHWYPSVKLHRNVLSDLGVDVSSEVYRALYSENSIFEKDAC